MTFNDFSKAVKAYCPDVTEVYPHNRKVDIVYRNSDKLYSYVGSYSQILKRLGAPVIDKRIISDLQIRLERERQDLLDPDPYGFGEDPEVTEATKQRIKELERKLAECQNYLAV